jgi:hypothetical protein
MKINYKKIIAYKKLKASPFTVDPKSFYKKYFW